MFYLLVCLTQDGWMEIFQAFQVEQSGGLVFETSNRVSAVFPARESYTEALGQENVPTMQERREDLCCKYMERMKSRVHSLFLKLLPMPVTYNYKLRENSEKSLLFNSSITCRTKRADSFFTFRYLK